jgi:hypothetical protein
MRPRIGIAGAAALGALLLSGCASADSQGLDLCSDELSERLNNTSDASVSAWDGGSVTDGVFVYTAILTMGDGQFDVSCEVVSSTTGFLLHGFDLGAN